MQTHARQGALEIEPHGRSVITDRFPGSFVRTKAVSHMSQRRGRCLALAILSVVLHVLASKRAAAQARSVPVAIYRDAISGDATRYYFSYRTAEEATRFGWNRLGVAFYAFASQAPGTVMVYAESPTTEPHSRYFLSTRSDDEAERDGWGVRGGAFWAYPSERPGTVAVIVETPINAPNTRYNFSTRSAADAERDGWRQLGIAFWAVDPQWVTAAPAPRPPVFPPERQLARARPNR